MFGVDLEPFSVVLDMAPFSNNPALIPSDANCLYSFMFSLNPADARIWFVVRIRVERSLHDEDLEAKFVLGKN